MTTLIRHSSESFGVGQATARLGTLFKAAGLGFKERELFTRSNQEFLDNRAITACNADLTALEMSHWSWKQFNNTNHIGFWSWELEDFPKQLRFARDLVDEVWTVSDFSANGIREGSALSVRKVPLPVTGRNRRVNKNDLEPFRFLISFDFDSDVVRKNPEAGIRAYKKAFSKNSRTQLIVKSINGTKHKMKLSSLKELAFERPDIKFIDSQLSSAQYLTLLDSTDCFISLHRAEGYGLNLADALAEGTPVIATGYSGNMEFMTESNSLPVPFVKAPVTNYAGFKLSSYWAQPDEEVAAELMLRIASDEKLRKKLSAKSREDMKNRFGLEQSVKNFNKDFPELSKHNSFRAF